MKVRILGGTGFIGSHLNTKLESQRLKVFRLSREEELDNKNIDGWRENTSSQNLESRVIVNLAGAWRNCSQKEITEANFGYPLRILREELKIPGPVVWIQASSYFQLFKKFNAEHKDLYAEAKHNFSAELKSKSEQSDYLNVVDVFLPHTTGPGESAERIFPMLASARLNNTTLDLTSGTSIMPVLDVRDLVNELAELISSQSRENLSRYTEIYPRVSGVMSLRSHIEKILDNPDDICRFGILKDRQNEFVELAPLEEYYKVNPEYLTLQDSFKGLIESI
jgi:NAD dependent epimerase/dehydratase family enzyme